MKTDICSFSTADNIRFCAIVLNATEFPDNIKFIPAPENVDPECKKRKVVARLKTIETGESEFFLGSGANYERIYEVQYFEPMI